MTSRTKKIFHASNALICGGGVLYGMVKWALPRPESEFGTAIHPLEPMLKSAHVLMAPALVFALGWIWRAHVSSQLRHRAQKNRTSGLALVALAAPMVFSGVFFQVTVNEQLRNLWSQVHLWSSGIWIVGSILHLYGARATQPDKN
ncbi:hypothetical protein EBZ37_07800 [bacterium]|nr:hypothetical protein [bacterium]